MPYNPRTISPAAKRKLQKNLRRVGLLEPLVLNLGTPEEPSSTLLSGHQRLAILDALEGSPDYEMDVSVVHLSEKEEIEQNAFFNNDGAMGSWDLDALGAALKVGADADAMGFDPMDLEIMFDGTSHAGILSVERAPDGTQAILQELDGIDADAKRPKLEETDEERDQRIAAGKALKKENIEKARAKDDSEWYLIVVCRDRSDRERLCSSLGLDPDQKYTDAEKVRAVIRDA